MAMSACAPLPESLPRVVARPSVRSVARKVARPAGRTAGRVAVRPATSPIAPPVAAPSRARVVVARLPLTVEHAPAEQPAPGLDFATIYDRWFHPVCRWARALGAIDEEVEDVAQDVFVIVQRRLPEFRNENLAGWLYRITARSTRDQRRRAWFRRLVHVKSDDTLDALAPAGPCCIDQLVARMTLTRLLDGMGNKKRAVLMLYELEGYTGEEIAELEAISIDTVWSRLRHAREDVRDRVDVMRRRGEL